MIKRALVYRSKIFGHLCRQELWRKYNSDKNPSISFVGKYVGKESPAFEKTIHIKTLLKPNLIEWDARVNDFISYSSIFRTSFVFHEFHITFQPSIFDSSSVRAAPQFGFGFTS